MSFFDALLRNLLRAADFLPIFYGVGFVVMFWSAKMQRLGDLVAGTIVVREQRQTLGRDLDWLDKVEAIPTTDFEKYHVPSERALSLIEKFLRRNEGLENARSNEIAAILARPLAERLGYRDQDREQIERPVLFLTRLFRTFWHGVRGEDQRNKTVRREVTVAPREEL